MQMKLFLMAASTSILLSSCYKKLFYGCANDKDVFQKEYSSLSNENSIIVSQENVAQKENDILNKLFDSLTVVNSNLRAENARLKQLDIDEIIQVDKAMFAYFNKIADIAGYWKPPCNEAANGFMRDFIAETDDPGGAGVDWRNKPVNHLADPLINLTTKEATNLLTAFTTFSMLNQRAFITNSNYRPDDWSYVKIFWIKTLEQIKDLGTDIVSLFGTDGTDIPTWAKTAANIASLYNSLKDKKCDNGSNANGWISWGVNSAANQGLNMLHAYHFDTYDASTRIGKITIVLEKCFNDLQQLDKLHHDPWLTPDWQISYYTILKATADKLSVVN